MNSFQTIGGTIMLSKGQLPPLPPWNGDNPVVVSTTGNFITDANNGGADRIIVGGGNIYTGASSRTSSTGIAKYSITGTYLAKIYSNNYSILLEDIAFYGGNVYATSYYTNNTGNLIIINSSNQVSSPSPTTQNGRRGLCFNTAGNAYIANSDTKTIGVYNRFTGLPIIGNLITGNSTPALTAPLEITLDNTTNNMYVIQSNNILKYNLNATPVSGSIFINTGLSTPADMKVYGNYLYVADTTNVKVYYTANAVPYNTNFITSGIDAGGLDINGEYLYVKVRNSNQVNRYKIH
jgi:hypothetical protein